MRTPHVPAWHPFGGVGYVGCSRKARAYPPASLRRVCAPASTGAGGTQRTHLLVLSLLLAVSVAVTVVLVVVVLLRCERRRRVHVLLARVHVPKCLSPCYSKVHCCALLAPSRTERHVENRIAAIIPLILHVSMHTGPRHDRKERQATV